jgi:hypothetical protein
MEEHIEEYDPLSLVPGNPGEIPDHVQTIESVGEAHHDFTLKRCPKPAVVIAMNKYFEGDLDKYSKNEKFTSELLHRHFNGGADAVKADLRLSTPHNEYTNAESLRRDLFLINGSEVNVKPLVFMISVANLETPSFKDVINELKTALATKYELRSYLRNGKLSVTHDAYKFDGTKGNPIDCNIMFSAATACDPQITGEPAIKSAIEENRFHSPISPSSVLVEGASEWANWKIETPPGNKYLGATITIEFGYSGDVILNIPRDLLAGPSVSDLAMIYDKIVSSRGNISPADIRTFVGDLSIKRQKPFSANITALYTQIINQGIRLLNIGEGFDLLPFIFILKEIGDMSQHKVAVKYKHLAVGSVDDLSTIAFLKRGGPLSYIPKENKRGEACILFRSAGTLHVATGLTPEEYAAQLESQRATIQAEYEAKLARKREKDEQAKVRAVLRTADIEEARRLTHEKRMEKIRMDAAERASRAVKFGQYSRGGARKRKYLGMYRRKTVKKQRGGSRNLEAHIRSLINALFMNLYYILKNPDAPTSLFNINTLSEDFIDFTLVGTFSGGETVLLNNKMLGLPLCSIIYILYETLEDLEEHAFEDQRKQIINNFLMAFNFTDEEIGRIQRYMNDSTLDTQLTGMILSHVSEPGEVIRPLTQSDKDTLRSLDAKIPGIIPYDYYILRSESERAGTLYETLTPAEIARTEAERAEIIAQIQAPAARPVNAPNAVLNNVATVVNAPNAVLNNAYETNSEVLPNATPTPIFQKNANMNVRKGKTAKKTVIKRIPYSKPGSTPRDRAQSYGYFKSMTGLTPRGIHVARKTRKRKNSTFKK